MPLQRRTQVGVFFLQPVQPRGLGGAPDGIRRGARERRIPHGMLALACFELAPPPQFFPGKRPDRRQHREAWLVRELPGRDDQALVGQGNAGVENRLDPVRMRARRLDHRRIVVAKDEGGGLGQESARERAQPAKQGLFLTIEQIVAPADRVADPALVRRPVERAARQHIVRAGEPSGDRVGRQVPGPGGGQLDRKGQAVELASDPRHRRGILASQAKIRPDGGRAVDEEAHSIRLTQRRWIVRTLFRWGRELGNLVLVLARHIERHAAGDEHRDMGAGGEDLDQRRSRFEDLFEIIDDEQTATLTRPGPIEAFVD